MTNRPRLLFCLILAAFAAGYLLSASLVQAAEPAQRKTTQSESYIPVEPIYTTILDGVRPRGLLLVEVGLDVPDAALRSRVSQALPVLRDAYVKNLMVYTANAVRPYRQPNIEDIATRMQAITDQTIGRKGAQVLMAQMAVRLTR